MPAEIHPQPPVPDASDAAAFGAVPAASVIAECLRVQQDAPARSRLGRLIGRSPLSADSRPWYVGALGELDVARRLDALGQEWKVLHAVPIGTRGSDIDHVVAGPAGVFTINTKFHEDAKVWVGSRRLLVNGQRTDHLRNARFEAARVSKLLSEAVGTDIVVAPLVVIVGAREITIREQPADVVVLRAPSLTGWLRRRKPQLEPDAVALLTETISRRETWTAAPAGPIDHTTAFASLQREVRGAKRTRLLWATAALLATIGVTAPLVLDLYSRVAGSG